MAVPSSNQPMDHEPSNSLWNKLSTYFPFPDSTFLLKISNIYKRTTRATSRRRRCSLPLPLPSISPDSIRVWSEASRVFDVLEDILDHIFLDLRSIQKNLEFWQIRAEGSRGQKVYFMLFERGPRALIDGTVQLIRDCAANDSGMEHLYYMASTHIAERIAILSKLRFALAAFLAQVHIEIDRLGEELVKDPEKALPLLLVVLNQLFAKLEFSIGHLHAMRESDSSVDGNYSLPLMFEKLPEVNQEGSQWTDCEIRDAINMIYLNLQKLDSYLSSIVAIHQKPRRVTLYWMRYTCGFVGISVCSLWLLRHSRLAGSSDIDNWIRDAKESTVGFWTDHVEQPLLSIRDDLFDTFRKRHKGVMELEEVQLTANSLHRMLLNFAEQAKGEKLSVNASDQEMLEIVMARYEKELVHPIQNVVFGGELVRALLIQIQKLKLDIETGMLELDQILKANEINFAILAALPAFFLSLLMFMSVRTWFKRDTRAEGRGRIARLQRRLLIAEVERRIMHFQACMDEGLEREAHCMFGLGLYNLDRLYRAVERHAKATGEWQCLKQDIIDLGNPGLQTSYKLVITSRLGRIYDCLLPSSRRQ